MRHNENTHSFHTASDEDGCQRPASLASRHDIINNQRSLAFRDAFQLKNTLHIVATRGRIQPGLWF